MAPRAAVPAAAASTRMNGRKGAARPANQTTPTAGSSPTSIATLRQARSAVKTASSTGLIATNTVPTPAAASIPRIATARATRARTSRPGTPMARAETTPPRPASPSPAKTAAIPRAPTVASARSGRRPNTVSPMAATASQSAITPAVTVRIRGIGWTGWRSRANSRIRPSASPPLTGAPSRIRRATRGSPDVHAA
jgi:hypothetical protein